MDGPDFGPECGTSLDDILEHFGKLGMKWGRRTGKSSKATSLRTPRPVSADVKTVKAAQAKAKKGTDALSNKELQSLVTRMNMEQQYGSLRSKQPTKMSKGRDGVKTILGVARTANEVYTFVNSPLGKQIRETIGNR